MNQFSSLDSIFPVGPNRVSGEVVSIEIYVFLDFAFTGEIHWKRKAWYVNASVNAWHLHRGLCRDLRDLVQDRVSTATFDQTKKVLAGAVFQSYVLNAFTGQQSHQFDLYLSKGGISLLRRDPTVVPLD